MPRELLDARDDLPEQGPCQVVSGKLQGEVPSMPEEETAGLEQSPLRARQLPALDGDQQDQPTQESAEVVGDRPRRQTDLIGPEPPGRPAARGGRGVVDGIAARAEACQPLNK